MNFYEFWAQLFAKYHAYVARENAALCAAAKANAAAVIKQQMLSEYSAVADIVATANNNIAEISTVRSVTDFSQIVAVPPLRVRRAKNGFDYCGWCFRLRLSAGCTANAAVLRRLLQTEVEAVTAARGVPRLFVDVAFGADRLVSVWATPLAALQMDGGCL